MFGVGGATQTLSTRDPWQAWLVAPEGDHALGYSRDYSRNYSRNYSRPPFRPPLRLAQLHQDRCATRRRDAGARRRAGVWRQVVAAGREGGIGAPSLK